jgi:drug/metabolite transporter (DMT)-like permease
MAGSAKRERAKLLGAYAATWIIWGSTFLAIRIGVESIPPFLMAGVRSVVAGGILWSWARLRNDRPPTAAQWRAAAVAGALFFLIGHGGLFWAEQRVASGPASLLVATEHFWVVLIAWLLPGGTRPSRRAAIAVALGLGGVALLTMGGRGAEVVDPLGAAAILVCALTWGMGLLYFRGERRPVSGLYAAGMPLLAGGAMLLGAATLFGEPEQVTAATFSPMALGALAYLIVFGSLVAFTALTWLTQTQGPGRAASYAYVNPLVAVLLGWALAEEHVGIRVLLSGAAIVLAVVLIVRGKEAESPAPSASAPHGSGRQTAAARRLREGEG